ncbi:MAG TPA: recombinase family protein [Candidatus Cybelea sp.]|jgi:DNA invertase Pin-like site-specific DNA recombinase
MQRKNAVSYIRVSTKGQEASGLGLTAQRGAVETFCEQNGYRVLQEFSEIESGRHPDRPILREALARARSSHALLVIAKLDRLARDVEFIAHLMNSDVKFAACDLPEANRLTIHIIAAVAEHEARLISDRTKEALAVRKARGKILGNPNTRNGLPADVTRRGLLAARVARRHLRDRAIEAVADEIKAGRAEGASYRQIALALNDDGYLTATGRPWGATAVWLAAQRLAP